MTSEVSLRPDARYGNAAPALSRTARRWAWRLAGAVAVVWGVVSLTFFALQLVPGDPAVAAVGGGIGASQEILDQARSEFGLDRPVLTQYGTYLADLIRGDLGTSYTLRTPVSEIIGENLFPTLILTFISLAVAWLLALTVSTFSTIGNRVAQRLATIFETVAALLPQFWLGSVLIIVFAAELGFLPATSSGNSAAELLLPVITLALPLAGYLGQIMREPILEALEAPFILTARARGESELRIRRVHVLRHAIAPAITLSAWAFGALISGAVVVEAVFARPGLGRVLLTAVTERDAPLVLGVVTVIAVVYVLVNLVADVITTLIDPRLTSPR